MVAKDFSRASTEDLISLEGRTAVITGGARGIGRAIAMRFAGAGANIVIADKDVGDCLDATVAALKKKGGKALGFRYDTRSMHSMQRAADQAVEEFGGLHIWVNDAGIYPTTPFLEISEEEWSEVIDTNITGVFHGSRAAVPHMKKKGGVIINLTSVAGLSGTPNFAHYCASKFGVRGLTAALASELGEHNIRVVAIAPTLIETPGTLEGKAEMDRLEGGDSFKQEKEEISLGRIGQPDDIARAALFLASDMAAFVSGTTLVVDGGNMALG